jgi:hypothetical protein
MAGEMQVWGVAIKFEDNDSTEHTISIGSELKSRLHVVRYYNPAPGFSPVVLAGHQCP